MKEAVAQFLQSEDTAWEVSGIAIRLDIPEDEAAAALNALVGEGKAVFTKKGKYAAPNSVGLISARAVVLRSGTLIARPLGEGDSMPIRPNTKLQCLCDDIILVRPDAYSAGGSRQCELVSVARRAHETFSAMLSIVSQPSQEPPSYARTRGNKEQRKPQYEKSPSITVKPYDGCIRCEICLEGSLMDAKDGDMVLLRAISWPVQNRPLVARVIRVMGEADHLRVQLKAIAEDAGFSSVFEEDVLKQAAAFPDAVRTDDITGREDLRSLALFTIDGEDAKDFDDAISLEKLADGAWQLGVHIADVSHYVLHGQPIDKEALRRGTSVYLPGLTLPMLPEELSSHLCSLMPNVDRLAMSLFMRVQEGRILDHRLAPSVIHSSARLTYTEVNRLFEKKENAVPEALRSTLENMLTVSRDLREMRLKRGSIDFDLSETGFTLDENNEPMDVHARERGEAERLIEDFMLAANETVAELARNTDLPFIYRIHEKPDSQKLHALEQFLGGLNVRVHLGYDPHPGILQDLLARTEKDSNAQIIRSMTIRALKRARYCEKPEGHYALAAKDYCHFTSPIRRYPDLQVHRMLKRLLAGKIGNTKQQTERMADLADQCSQQEFAATLAEREADDLLKAYYMSHYIGETFDGVVSSVTNWGAYVTLSNKVEGLVPISSLHDYYQCDETKSALTGLHTNRAIRLGDRVQVKVVRSDTVRREIDFEMIGF